MSQRDQQRLSGNICAAKNCYNSYRKSSTSFFRFPKDVERAKKWALLSGREDLLDQASILHARYRICGGHFENRMFLNDLRNRLQPNAEPTIFQGLERSSKSDHSYSIFTPSYEEKENISEDTIDRTESVSAPPPPPLESPTLFLESETEHYQTDPLEDILTDGESEHELTVSDCPNTSTSPVPSLPTSSCGVQTPKGLSAHSPRKVAYRKKIRKLQQENARLNKRIKELEKKVNSTEPISSQKYKANTEQLCPSKEIADIINVEVAKIGKLPKGRRYSPKFKPKLNKRYLMN